MVRAVIAAVAMVAGWGLVWDAVRAEPPREVILVVSADPSFRAAVDGVLDPAHMSTASVEAPPPTLADITHASRDLSDRERATGVVWLVADPSRTTLVVYDREIDRVLVRTLASGVPLDAAHAAETARMASTMLRALRVTPDLNVPPPPAAEAPAIRAAAAAAATATVTAVAAPPAVAPAPQLAISFGLGAHEHQLAARAAPAVDGAILWRPNALGVAVSGSYTPVASVEDAAFTGTATDDTLAALVRLPIDLLGDGRVHLVGLAGPALHVVALHGTPASGARADVRRYDAAARLGAVFGYALNPSVDVGVSVSFDYLFERQQFDVQAVEFLAAPRFEAATSVVLTVQVL